MQEDHYDAIIIGSGIGGMTAGALLTKFSKQKVLILEQHFKPGGFTHIFKREGKFLWDVGVHYIGGMEKNSFIRNLFDMITDEKVKWKKMPHLFEKFVYPDLVFDVPSDEKEYKKKLIDLFPSESNAIENYFNDIKTISSFISREFTLKSFPPIIGNSLRWLNLLGAGSALDTTSEYMEKNFKDAKLKSLLVSQWGDYGLPPSQSALAMHALVVEHYFGGGFYPIGGSGKIAESIKQVLQTTGGSILINHEVKEILIKDNKAIGVKVLIKNPKGNTEKEFFANKIISDAGASNTYLKLIPESVNIPFRDELRSMSHSVSALTLYVGFKEDPKKMGFEGENHWIYNSFDHEDNFNSRNEILNGKINMCYLSFPSMKDTDPTGHTAELITFVDYTPFEKWKDGEWKNRGEDYKELKEKIANTMLDYIEKHYPGFRSMVEYYELSTPLSSEYFTGHPSGSIYGIPCTPDRFRKDWLGVHTPITNLHLTGADAATPGVVGAMMGGFSTSISILDLPGIMGAIQNIIKF
ncbi:MAG: NAD(P)/FAD-dependent oxidoreductase [Leptospiraceae bacterium]|nr:NAD(P)/FAD-dependent oxidoreductase [Leptospiraceae bacterium]